MSTPASSASSREPHDPAPPDARALEARTLALLGQRDAQASICPSEVARSFAGDEAGWRALMAPARAAAARLAEARRVRITQGTREVDPRGELRGALRIRRGPRFEEDRARGA